VALPFTLKKDLKAKEELWKLKYFSMQKYNLQKTKIPTNFWCESNYKVFFWGYLVVGVG
jgi:hypothetical protein